LFFIEEDSNIVEIGTSAQTVPMNWEQTITTIYNIVTQLYIVPKDRAIGYITSCWYRGSSTLENSLSKGITIIYGERSILIDSMESKIDLTQVVIF